MIPNIFHFTFYVKPVLGQQPRPFSILHYLCLRSCLETQKPERLIIHTDGQITGYWWQQIKDRVEVRPYNFRQVVNGKPVSHMIVPSDLARVDILYRHGGFYADLDTLFVRPLTHLRESEQVFVQFEVHTGKPITSFFAAPAGHRVLARWKEPEYTDMATSGEWDTYASEAVYRLSREFPGEVEGQVLDRMPCPAFLQEGAKQLFESDTGLSGSSIINVCQSQCPKHVARLIPEHIFEYNSAFNRAVRQYLERPQFDLTVVMPVSIEHPDRLENLLAITRYLLDQLCIDNLIVVEGGARPTVGGVLDPRIKYMFVTVDEQQPWNRSRMFNTALPWVMTRSVAVWDTDVILSLPQVRAAVRAVVEDEQWACVGYHSMYHVKRRFLQQVKAGQFNYGIVDEEENVTFNTGVSSAAGLFFMNTAAIKHLRGMNELFWGWGAEDDDLLVRMLRLSDGRVVRVSGPLIHIDHTRTERSLPDQKHIRNSQAMRYRILTWPAEDIRRFFGIEKEISKYCQLEYAEPPLEEEMEPMMKIENALPPGQPPRQP